MADIFDQIGSKDIFDQISPSARTPADSSAEMKDAQWGANNPTLRAVQNTASQAVVNPIVQASNGISPAINGLNKLEGNNYNIPQIQGPNMSQAPLVAKIEGDVAGGAGQGVAATALGAGNPILGYGALSGLSAFGKGEPVVPAAVKGVVSAVPQMIAGKVGSSLASAAAKPIGGIVAKYAPNVGTALGMGAASAGQASLSGQNPVEATATGAAFGALSPMNPLGSKVPMTSANHDAMIENEGAPIYRNILNPGKGIINKVEIKGGGNIDDSMALAAREALPINSNEGKIDNTAAIEKLKAGNVPLYDQQNQILASNPDKQFNLQQIGDQVKAGLVKTNKNAVDLSAAQQKVDNEINAEILRHGDNVDGQTLNMIKQGMWGKSYNPLEPNANDTARAIGFGAKDEIEKAYPLDSIKENNASLGQRLQLQKILEQTHGQVIQGGKIGKYVSGTIGGAAGLAVSSHLPVLGEAIGPIVGFKAGEKVNSMINDPARITGNWAKKLGNINVVNAPVKPPVSQNPATTSMPAAGTPQSQQTFPQGSMNPLANVQQGIAAGTKAVGGKIAATALATTLGLSSVFNPSSAQAQTVKDPERLKLNANQYIMKNEGWRAMPYMDTDGNKTVGYGFKQGGMAWKYVPDDVKQGRRAMTKQEGVYAFNKAYPDAVASASKFAGDSWEDLSVNQQKSLIDMSYQMGSLKFPRLRQAVESGNFNTAAREILNSKYAKKDAPQRALQNAILMQQ